MTKTVLNFVVSEDLNQPLNAQDYAYRIANEMEKHLGNGRKFDSSSEEIHEEDLKKFKDSMELHFYKLHYRLHTEKSFFAEYATQFCKGIEEQLEKLLRDSELENCVVKKDELIRRQIVKRQQGLALFVLNLGAQVALNSIVGEAGPGAASMLLENAERIVGSTALTASLYAAASHLMGGQNLSGAAIEGAAFSATSSAIGQVSHDLVRHHEGASTQGYYEGYVSAGISNLITMLTSSSRVSSSASMAVNNNNDAPDWMVTLWDKSIKDDQAKLQAELDKFVNSDVSRSSISGSSAEELETCSFGPLDLELDLEADIDTAGSDDDFDHVEHHSVADQLQPHVGMWHRANTVLPNQLQPSTVLNS